ncbi:hypothetical protein [Bradyrhizobium sp. 27S5]|uniref:hypothetical protein n=1 Tax=Bradyrhizobium sp. 27S5 TaxID=3139728 RepID=UPI0030CC996D
MDINMSLEYMAIVPLAAGAALAAANLTVIVARILHKDKLVRRVIESFSGVIWIFRLGGGSGRSVNNHARPHINGGT